MKKIALIFKYLKKYKLYAILAPLLIILEVIMELFLPNIMSDIINVGVSNGDKNYVIVRVIIMFALSLIGVLGGLGSSYFAARASENVAADMREDAFRKITNLSFLNLGKIKPGHLLTVITNDISTIGHLIMMALRILIRVPVIFFGSIIMAFFIDVKLTLIILIFIPIVFTLVIFILKKAFPYFNKMQECIDDVNSIVRENVSGIRVVKAFTMEEKEINHFDYTNKKLLNTTLKGIKLVTISMPIMMFAINLSLVLILWVGGVSVSVGNLEIGDIFAFSQYTTNILTSIMMASMVIMMASRSIVSCERVNDLLKTSEDFKDKEDSIELKDMQGKVEFRNVSFAYEGGSGDAVLKDLNFIVNPKEKIAIVGAIGSGKSTLVSLIARFYDVSTGEILIDDVPLKKIKLSFLRRNVGFAFQQAYIFSKTIKENIAFGNKMATKEEVEASASISAASDFIESKEKKYDYVLEQRGVNLSGGQKQRLAIARAILNNPKILILDDSTSAVDVKTAKIIKNGLEKAKKCTTFIITSRIAEALDADRVLVLDDGKIVGFDTPEKLLVENEYYKAIYNSQLKEDK